MEIVIFYYVSINDFSFLYIFLSSFLLFLFPKRIFMCQNIALAFDIRYLAHYRIFSKMQLWVYYIVQNFRAKDVNTK